MYYYGTVRYSITNIMLEISSTSRTFLAKEPVGEAQLSLVLVIPAAVVRIRLVHPSGLWLLRPAVLVQVTRAAVACRTAAPVAASETESAAALAPVTVEHLHDGAEEVPGAPEHVLEELGLNGARHQEHRGRQGQETQI